MQPTSCILQVTPKEIPKIELPLVTFSNGKLKPESLDKIELKAYESISTEDGLGRKKPRKALVAKTNRLVYVGYNHGTEAVRMSGLCKYMVGSFNKQTGIMKLFDAQVYQMNPLLKAQEIDNVSKIKEDATYGEKVDQLTKAFGSKKRKKAMETRLRNKVSEDNLGSSLKEAIKETAVGGISGSASSEVKNISSETLSDAIPKQNKEAKRPEDVYCIDDIIPPDEFDALGSEVSAFVEATAADISSWKSDTKYPMCILRALSKLPSEKVARLHKAKQVMHMNYMLQVLKLRYNDMRRKDPLPSVPQAIKMKLLQRFTLESTNERGSTVRSFPDRMKDKVLAYIMVLALIMENYEVDLGLLQTDFKLPLTRLTKVVGALGCQLTSRKTSEGMSKIAKLSIPLTFPKESMKRRRVQK